MDTHKDTCGPNSHSRYQDDLSPDSVFDWHKISYDKIDYKKYYHGRFKGYNLQMSETTIQLLAWIHSNDLYIDIHIMFCVVTKV